MTAKKPEHGLERFMPRPGNNSLRIIDPLHTFKSGRPIQTGRFQHTSPVRPVGVENRNAGLLPHTDKPRPSIRLIGEPFPQYSMGTKVPAPQCHMCEAGHQPTKKMIDIDYGHYKRQILAALGITVEEFKESGGKISIPTHDTVEVDIETSKAGAWAQMPQEGDRFIGIDFGTKPPTTVMSIWKKSDQPNRNGDVFMLGPAIPVGAFPKRGDKFTVTGRIKRTKEEQSWDAFQRGMISYAQLAEDFGFDLKTGQRADGSTTMTERFINRHVKASAEEMAEFKRIAQSFEDDPRSIPILETAHIKVEHMNKPVNSVAERIKAMTDTYVDTIKKDPYHIPQAPKRDPKEWGEPVIIKHLREQLAKIVLEQDRIYAWGKSSGQVGANRLYDLYRMQQHVAERLHEAEKVEAEMNGRQVLRVTVELPQDHIQLRAKDKQGQTIYSVQIQTGGGLSNTKVGQFLRHFRLATQEQSTSSLGAITAAMLKGLDDAHSHPQVQFLLGVMQEIHNEEIRNSRATGTPIEAVRRLGGTVTGRMSSKGPNESAKPRSQEEAEQEMLKIHFSCVEHPTTKQVIVEATRTGNQVQECILEPIDWQIHGSVHGKIKELAHKGAKEFGTSQQHFLREMAAEFRDEVRGTWEKARLIADIAEIRASQIDELRGSAKQVKAPPYMGVPPQANASDIHAQTATAMVERADGKFEHKALKDIIYKTLYGGRMTLDELQAAAIHLGAERAYALKTHRDSLRDFIRANAPGPVVDKVLSESHSQGTQKFIEAQRKAKPKRIVEQAVRGHNADIKKAALAKSSVLQQNQRCKCGEMACMCDPNPVEAKKPACNHPFVVLIPRNIAGELGVDLEKIPENIKIYACRECHMAFAPPFDQPDIETAAGRDHFNVVDSENVLVRDCKKVYVSGCVDVKVMSGKDVDLEGCHAVEMNNCTSKT